MYAIKTVTTIPKNISTRDKISKSLIKYPSFSSISFEKDFYIKEGRSPSIEEPPPIRI